MDLREFIDVLDEKGLLMRIKREVDVKYEIATIMKMLDGKPLLFENVKGFEMPVLANVCSTRDLIAIGLEVKKNEIITKLTNAIDNPKEPKITEAKDYVEMDANFSKVPILTYYPLDGGPYIASAIVIANDKELGLNTSYHRMMVISENGIVMRILSRTH